MDELKKEVIDAANIYPLWSLFEYRILHIYVLPVMMTTMMKV